MAFCVVFCYFARLLNSNIYFFTMKHILLLFLIFCTSILQAQNIEGRVVDSLNNPVDGANVVLLRADSSFVDVQVTDTAGVFSFAHNLESFNLVVQHLAHHSFSCSFSSPDVGDIVIEPLDLALGEVVVSGERPLVRVEDGRLSYDLEQLVRDKVAGNTYEALTKLPGVSEKDGQLSLLGANSLSVIINGKPSTMTAEQVYALLKSTPVSRVEKVEVMYSAPPQYHVRGAALNIVLKKDTEYSFQGEVGGDYTNRFYNTGGLHTFLRLATPENAFDVMYSINRVEEVQDLDMLSLHTLAGVKHDIRQFQKIRGDLLLHNTRASYEHNFNENNNISFAYNCQFKTDASRSSFSFGNFQNSTNRKELERDVMHNFSLQALTGIGLKAGVDYTIYENRSNQLMNVEYIGSGQYVMSQRAGQKVNSLHAYADQTHTLGKGWTIGYGASYRNSESEDYQLFSAESTLAGTNVNSSLSEHTGEAYISFGRTPLEGLGFSLSATVEFYKVNKREHWTLYPQATFVYMTNPDHILQGSLNVEKLYPSYWQMQDAVSYIDGYSEMHNSPGLEPARMYNFSTNYIYKQKYVFGLFCNYMHKFFAQAIYQSPTRLALIYQNHNWDYLSQSGVVAVVPYSPVSWFNTRATLVGFYIAQRCDNFFDIGFEDKNLAAMLAVDNSFRVNDKLVFELNGFVQSPVTQGTFSVETMWQVSAGAKWDFAGGKGTLSCFYNDIFNSTMGDMKMDYKGQYMIEKNNPYTRHFTLSLTYRFGGYRKKDVNAVDVSRFGH